MDRHVTKAKTDSDGQLAFEAKPEYLHVCIFGANRQLKQVLEQWKQIAEQCHEQGYDKVLIQKEAEGLVSFSEQLQFAQELPKLGFIGLKVAFSDRQVTRHFKNQFAENVAVNYGINVRVFNDAKQAEAWLLN